MKLNKNTLFIISLIIVILISYSNTFQNEFVWDDDFFIVDNIHIKDLNNIPSFFFEPSVGNLYRPIRSVFYVITHKIWQLNTFGYHLNSIILHTLITIILFYITLKVTKNNNLSFVTSLFFAVHPVHTARVTNMTAGFDLYGILFMLLSFLLYLSHNISDKKSYFYFSISTYIVALFSSEEAIIFIPLLFLYEFSFNKKISFKDLIILLKRYLSYIFVTIFYLIARFSVLEQVGRVETYFEHTFLGTLLTTVKIFIKYIFILFYPLDLTIEHVLKFETSIFSLSFLTYFFLLLVVLFVFVKSYKRSKIVFFSIGFFMIAFLPFSNIFPQVTIMADRYLYMPSYGFCLLLSFLIFKIKDVQPLEKPSKKIILILVITLVVLGSYLTIDRNTDFKDNFTLLHKTIKDNKYSGTKTNNMLSIYYRKDKDYVNAEKYAVRAIELSNKNYYAYENLGTIYAYNKLYNQSIEYYMKSLELKPDFYLAYNNLGLVYSYMKDYDKALYYLKKAIKINPNLAKAHHDIATVYAQTGEFDKAKSEFELAIKINPYEEDYKKDYNVLLDFLEKK